MSHLHDFMGVAGSQIFDISKWTLKLIK